MNYDHLKRPLVLVIFGITGDLAQRKLLPALYQLLKAHNLPEQLHIVGVSRRDVTREQVYERLKEFAGPENYSDDTEQRLRSSTEMVQMDLDNADAYRDLLAHLQEIEKPYGNEVGRLYYLSIPAQTFAPIVRLLGQTGHAAAISEGNKPRLLVEKPFGYDVQSARDLIHAAGEYFKESQVYRIDHYLAKETAQNILTFRSRNAIFESIWNRDHISRIAISARESLDIEGRAAFYEQTGALRDILQNHLLQLLAITTMERPVHMDSAEIHEAKYDIFKAIKPIPASEVAQKAVRAQYDGYRSEVGNSSSTIETYAKINLEIGNEQWRGVPITLETGKALDAKHTDITICFRQRGDEAGDQNQLTFRIQPNEGIGLRLQAKRPGLRATTDDVDMSFDYDRSFDVRQPGAYERVIVDAIRGDQTLFASSAEVVRSWEIVENILQVWSGSDKGLLRYPKGSAGPVENAATL